VIGSAEEQHLSENKEKERRRRRDAGTERRPAVRSYHTPIFPAP